MNDPIVTVEHVRRAKLCMRGVRFWAIGRGLDYAQFLEHGIPLSVVEATGDAFALRVAKIVREDMEKANGKC